MSTKRAEILNIIHCRIVLLGERLCRVASPMALSVSPLVFGSPLAEFGGMACQNRQNRGLRFAVWRDKTSLRVFRSKLYFSKNRKKWHMRRCEPRGWNLRSRQLRKFVRHFPSQHSKFWKKLMEYLPYCVAKNVFLRGKICYLLGI